MGSGDRNDKKKQRWKAREYSDEERYAGIVRLLAEACCARLRKQGRLKTVETPEANNLPLNTDYDFLH